MPARKQAPPVSMEQVFVATAGKRRIRTQEDVFNFADDEGRAKRGSQDTGMVVHETAEKVTMWKPDGHDGWLPREVPATNIEMLLKEGWAVVCPMCGTTDCTSDPNSCNGRAKSMYRTCPECNKKVYDEARPVEDGESEGDEAIDEFRISDDAYAASTPQSRTKARLDRHMLAYHPEQAAARGLMPQTPRDPTDQRTGR